MLVLGILGFSMFLTVAVVYTLYFALVIWNKRSIASFVDHISSIQSDGQVDDKLEGVSIIVSTFNEAKVITRKIHNLSELNYPKSKLEIIVYDDASSDNTASIAEKTLWEKRLRGSVIVSPTRLGLNRSLNIAMQKAKYDLICVTDSDVLLHKDSLKNAVKVLKGFSGAGGVTGHIQPVFETKTGVAQTAESSYRDFYHVSMLGESAIHSAFPGNGPLIVYDKSKVPFAIPQDYGSTDGNIAINVIKQGLRFIYVPNSIVYEPSPENLKQHRLQKIRRAKRLIQVFLRNKDITLNKKYGSFGRSIFPLKLAMLAFCPLLLFLGTFLLAAHIILSQDFILFSFSTLLVAAIAVSGFAVKRIGSLLSSFILHQFYLLIGLVSSFRKSVFWKTIDRRTSLEFKGKSGF